MSEDSAATQGQLRLHAQFWVTMTTTAHEILKQLESAGDTPLTRSDLAKSLDTALVRAALELLRNGEWAKPSDAAGETWICTERGKEHLQTINQQQQQISERIYDWLLANDVNQDDLSPVSKALETFLLSGLMKLSPINERLTVPNLIDKILQQSCNITLPAAVQNNKETVIRLLERAKVEVEEGKACPLISTICRQILEIAIEDFHKGLPSEDISGLPLNVVIDTNVLSRLLFSSESQDSELLEVFHELKEERRARFYVLPKTVEETRRILAGGECEVFELIAASRKEAADNKASTDFRANPFARNYVQLFGGQIPYEVYADRVELEILGNLGKLPGEERNHCSGFEILEDKARKLLLNIRLLPWQKLGDCLTRETPKDGYRLEEWPSYNETRLFMKRWKHSTFAVRHDVELLRRVLQLHQQQRQSAVWVIWTEDYSLREYEIRQLKLYEPERRLARDTRMMKGLLKNPPSLIAIEHDILRSLLALAVTPEANREQLEKLVYLQSPALLDESQQDPQSLLTEAFSDPYHVWTLADIIDESEEQKTKDDGIPASTVKRPPKSMAGWPESTDHSRFPRPRTFHDIGERLLELLLPLGSGQFIDLSGDLSEYAVAHGPLAMTTGDRAIIGGHVGPRVEAWELDLCVHSVAHIDLPWALRQVHESLKDKDRRHDVTSREANALWRSIVMPRERSAVIADFRRKSAALMGLLEELPPGGNEWVLSEEGQKQLPEILNHLWIRKEDLESTLLNQKISLRGKWLVIHTGWPELFHPIWPDVSAPGFELWHAWTLHPYIDKRFVDWLVKQEVYGVATDAAMLDSPQYAFPRSAEETTEPAVADAPWLPIFPPAHTELLIRNHPLLESIRIPSGLVCKHAKDYARDGILESNLFTFGLGMNQMRDGALTKVLLRVSNE